MIVFSVAHSSMAPGAMAASGLLEHVVSQRASQAAADSLNGQGIKSVVYDCGPLMPSAYSVVKPSHINTLGDVQLALELHCNAAEDTSAAYCEAIYWPGSTKGQSAAELICSGFANAYAINHKAWPVHGARANDLSQDLHWDFFLRLVNAPAVIIEPLFISNPVQAEWLATGGAESYGLVVASAVAAWVKQQGATS